MQKYYLCKSINKSEYINQNNCNLFLQQVSNIKHCLIREKAFKILKQTAIYWEILITIPL